MTKILEALKFWKKKNNNLTTTSSSASTSTSSTSVMATATATATATSTSNTTSFLVPDIKDITPFLTNSNNHPISMRDLLVAISTSSSTSTTHHSDQLNSTNQSNHPIQILLNNHSNYYSIKSKRKLDSLNSIQINNNLLNNSTSLNHHTFKKQKLIQQQQQQQIKTNTLNSTSIQLIHGLPSHVWSKVFQYNQLEELQCLLPTIPSPTNPSTCKKTNKLLSNQIQLALDAQQHRHDLIRISKSLRPIVKKAAWSTLIISTLKMFDHVAQKLESNSDLTAHLRTCIILYLPNITNTLNHSTQPSHLTPRSLHPERTPNKTLNPISPKSTSRLPQPKKIISQHVDNSNSNLQTQLKPKSTNINQTNTPTQRRSIPTKQNYVSSQSNKKSEKFHSVLIPPLPLSKDIETNRNTKVNSTRRIISPIKKMNCNVETETEELLLNKYDEQKYFEEIILTSSLPSLFLSIARSIQVFCVIGEEKLATRALKSLSVLSSLLTNLVELYIEGGGQFNDLSSLVEGLRSNTIRGQPGSLQVLSISGPNSTLSISSSHTVSPPNQSAYSSILSSNLSRSNSFTCPLDRPTSSSSSSNSSNHLSIQHVILGNGIPLTIEQLHWLITSITSLKPGLKSLRVSLKSAGEESLRSSINSSHSGSTRPKTASTRALLSRTFERIGPSLERLVIQEDWNSPLTNCNLKSTRRVTFEDAGDHSTAGLLDEPLAFCKNLVALGLSNGPLCSVGLLNLLPFTLKLIEIHHAHSEVSKSNLNSLDSNQASSGFNSDDIWLARSQAALFGLETIRIFSDSPPASSNSAPFRIWKSNGPLNGFQNLLKSGVLFDFVSS